MLNRARYSPVLDRFAGSGLGRLALVLGAAWGLSCAMHGAGTGDGYRLAAGLRLQIGAGDRQQ